MRTALYDQHVALKAKIVDFHGWEMPIQYRGIMEEHTAVRECAGLFDLSHMGRISVSGLAYERWLDQQITPPLEWMKRGQVRYGFLLNDNGGVIDDILAAKFKTRILLVVNAGNRIRVLQELQKTVTPTVEMKDQTQTHAMIAIQGPKAMGFWKEQTGLDATLLKYYHAKRVKLGEASLLISRTGYTGEDGIEVIGKADRVVSLWKRLVEQGKSKGIIPCGLGARDTLRLEAGMPLFGHELSEEITPLEAGLEFAAPFGKIFRGREALLKQKTEGVRRTLVGFKLGSKRIARHGYAVYRESQAVGFVTSGTFSPTLQASIGMAYVDAPLSAAGAALEVDIRGKRESLSMCALPFVNKTRPKR